MFSKKTVSGFLKLMIWDFDFAETQKGLISEEFLELQPKNKFSLCSEV